MSNSCKKCKFFKSRQGKGKLGECRVNPPTIQLGSTMGGFPIIEETTWCGKFFLNLDRYQVDGKKIYTKKTTRTIGLDSTEQGAIVDDMNDTGSGNGR